MLANYSDDELTRESVISFVVVNEEKHGVREADNIATLLEDSFSLSNKEKHAVVSYKVNGDSAVLGRLDVLISDYLNSCFDNNSIKQAFLSFLDSEDTCYEFVVSPQIHILCTKESTNVISYTIKDSKGRRGAVFCYDVNYSIDKVFDRFKGLIFNGEIKWNSQGR